MRSPALARVWICAAVGLAGAGCLGGSLLASSRSMTRVESIPSGAQVFVMGQLVGITPVDVEGRLVFPIDYPQGMADLYGKVLLRKKSCKDLVRALDLEVANQGLLAELQCSSVPSRSGTSGSSPAVAGGFESRSDEPDRSASTTLDDRLSEIDELRAQGLVDAEEYETLRERVLSETLTGESAVDALHQIDALRAAGSIEENEFQTLRKLVLEGL